MPGPISHMMYGFGIGAALRTVSDDKFTWKHMVIFALCCFFGPDIGAFTEFVCKEMTGSPEFGGLVMHYVHHAVYFPLFVAPITAFPYRFLSSLEFQESETSSNFLTKVSLRRGAPLSYKQTWLLCVAGGLSHFYFDTVFEENGRDNIYLWILSTGYWEGAWLDPLAMVVIGGLCSFLILGFYYCNRSPQVPTLPVNNSQSAKHQKHRHSFFLFLVVDCLYLCYLWLRTYGPWVTEKIPVAGEEADLGVMTFMTFYFLLPLYLLVCSME